MNKEKLKNEIKDMLAMIFDSYSVLNHYQVELLEDTLKSCLEYLEGNKNEKINVRC